MKFRKFPARPFLKKTPDFELFSGVDERSGKPENRNRLTLFDL
jgi:hypothetical protein